MGYTRHRFFVVHTHNAARAEDARAIALNVFAHAAHLVGPIMRGVVNSEHGFIVWTSGSKIGWSEDDAHVAKIAALIDALSQMPEPPRWCRIDSGEDDDDIAAEHGEDGNYEHVYTRTRVAGADAD